MRTKLWDTTFQNIIPGDPLSSQLAPQYPTVVGDVLAKQNASFQASLVDPFALWVAYGILYSENVNIRLSDIVTLSNFTSYNAPFPLFTSVGSFFQEGQCYPIATSPQYEFNPYEFGSWDTGIQAFTPTKYLGSALNNGQPVNAKQCISHFDHLGFTFGASSAIFAALYCNKTIEQLPIPLVVALEDIVKQAHPENATDIFALYPNPFYGYSGSPLVQSDPELYLVDGGFVGSDVPIWPFIQKQREVDVIIAADISEDMNNLPNGTQIRFTYERAQEQGLTRMPFIPTSDVFVAQGLNTRATFFGCGDASTATIIFLPNVPYIYPSGQSSLRTSYSALDTDLMVANGVLIGTQKNDADWPFCLACGIKNNDGPQLPDGCQACLDKYCYYQ